MQIFLGADHRGYELKEKVKRDLERRRYEVFDVGADEYDKDDDYVDFAAEVAKRVQEEKGSVGILLCGSGHGVDIVANRFSGVRSILGFNRAVVKQGREHEDANVLSIPAGWIDELEVIGLVRMFLEAEFSGKKRYKRRLEKISRL